MMQPWQQKMLNTISGFKKGELMIATAGRQTGKSTMDAYMRMWNDIRARPVEDLKLSEGKVYGSRYHCVEPVGGNWLEMEFWCLDTMGKNGSAWDQNKAPQPNARWYMNDRRFWFREEKDRMMFVLKWR
jgi:hypothetical protein